jgi:hypothetical protein
VAMGKPCRFSQTHGRRIGNQTTDIYRFAGPVMTACLKHAASGGTAGAQTKGGEIITRQTLSLARTAKGRLQGTA